MEGNMVVSFLVRCVFQLMHLLAIILSPLFALIYDGKRKDKLPAIDNSILLMSATELATNIRKRKIKAVEVMEAFIRRNKAIHPTVNALITLRFQDAIEDAKKIDQILDSSNIPESMSAEKQPLLGVPFTAKEAFAVKGLPNTSGLKARLKTHFMCDFDADAVANLKLAGAIPIGQTNCSELCMWYESSNLIYGRTNNPYHPGRIVGGSSGGEACVLAAAGSVIGIGSDIGGSIRMPAFFNGVFGHKPSGGVVSNTGQFPNAINEAQTFLLTGPMTRYASDLKPLLKAMAGPDIAKLNLDEEVDVKKLKVYYMVDDAGGFMSSPVDPQIKEAVTKAASHFHDLGCEVQSVSLKDMHLSFPIWTSMMSSSDNPSFCSLLGGGTECNPFYELLLWLLQCPRHTLPAIALGLFEKVPFTKKQIAFFRGKCQLLKDKFDEMLKTDGIFLYPTHPVPAPYHNQPVTLLTNFAYTGIFNVLGLPTTQVPMGFSKQGVPIGIQMISNVNMDRLSLAGAIELEKAFGGWIPPSCD